MKLLSIRLCNFRQFYGKTPEIHLASGQRNTTVVHGNNGAGKTTLLNAFTWVLYERFTDAFASPELLINKRAITEVQTGTSVECSAEVNFEHESKRYQVKRKCFVYEDVNGKIQYGQNNFFMLYAGDDGNWYPPPQQPEDIINQILPESLHRYFFFDGEHIDHQLRHGHKGTIAEDTKELLGVKVLDRSIEHLKKAKKSLQDEFKNLGESDLKKLVKQEAKLEQDLEKLSEKQQTLTTEISQQEELKKIVTAHLLEVSGAEELKQLKIKLESQEKNLRQNLVSSREKVKKLISNQAYIVFLDDINQKFHGLIDRLRDRGELPSGIKQQFVQQLLERKQCICGSELHEESPAYFQVRDWMNKAGIADVEEAAIRLESSVTEIEGRISPFWQEVDDEQASIQQVRGELSLVESELDEIKNKFRDYPDGDIKNLQTRLDAIEDSLKDLRLDLGANKNQREIATEALEVLKKQIQKQQQKEEKQNLVQRRMLATQDAIDRITEVRKRLENQFRLSLEKRVQEIFSEISFTPYLPRISSEYELKLLENTTGVAVPVAASTGENQILSLAFIGGIIDRVREWSQKNTLMGIDSSTFPIVMDSPFGSLDHIYRRKVAHIIPRLANQLVVLATKTQWRGEVEEEMSSYIGKEYVLVYHSPKLDCPEDAIELGGVTYPLVKRSPNEFEYTEIIEVTHRE
ncbi:AAA family ATPase [Pannus brasiliensis CCIBt3594]|uniref:Nuclease SbcCD subunit C n=1 Tax=Pannus brasiliensis CCIBt3594 TaxID=1427578 RepID=A0AAW9QX83_9CHRO